MHRTDIEWTDYTSNPLRVENSQAFYCVKVSPGCKNCYAEVMSKRLAAIAASRGSTVPFAPYKVMAEPPRIELRREILAGWARKKPGKIFVSSMTDVFGEFVPGQWIFEILDAMCAAKQQIFQVLTKRAERMHGLVNSYCQHRGIRELPEHIWLGVSVEDQERADERIPWLLSANCAVRFLSCEPLLGIVNLMEVKLPPAYKVGLVAPAYINCLTSMDDEHFYNHHQKIDWVIVGGESGHKARPMHPDWVRLLRTQCAQHETAFFFKQWGEWMPVNRPFEHQDDVQPLAKNEQCLNLDGGAGFIEFDVYRMRKVGKHKAGNLLDGVVYNEFPNNAR